MPQMAPLMWTSLFSLFLILLFLTSTKISFTKMFVSLNKTLVVKANEAASKYSWKW